MILRSTQAISELPEPEFADVTGVRHELDVFRAIDGTRRTSIKKIDKRVITLSFLLHRLKSLEVQAFLNHVRDREFEAEFKGDVWRVRLIGNPVEYTEGSRDRVSLQIQLEGDLWHAISPPPP